MRVLTEKKRAAIIAAAGRMFAKHGYGGTTMTMIAAEAGASKATLYRYFDDKPQVFAAYVVAQGEDHRDLLDRDIPLGEDCAESLLVVGRLYMSIVLSPRVIEVNRLVIAEAARFPELSEIYVSNGPGRVIALVERSLRAAQDRGWLRLDDPADAAWIFKSLCERTLLERAMWGFPVSRTDPLVERNLQIATRCFLASFSTVAAAG
jgi:TetR/AcrR family transcriptional repressor of mexJK operon